MNDPLRITFAGTSHVHLPDYAEACRARGDIRIVGACLLDEDSSYRFPVDVPIVAAPGDLAAHDLCVVTTDIASHESVAAAMTAPSVFVEKPLGTSAAAARRVVEILRRDGRTLHTGFFLRHESATRVIRDRLAARRIGRLREVRMTYEHHGLRRGWLAEWPAHLDSARMGYGVFGDLAGHLIDLCHATIGSVGPNRCTLQWESGARSDVGGEAVLRTPGGVPVRLRAGAVATRVRLEIRFEGDRGALLWADGQLSEISSGQTRVLVRDAMPTPLRGFLSVLDEVRGGRRRGATAAQAVAVNRTLDRLHAAASIDRRTTGG